MNNPSKTVKKITRVDLFFIFLRSFYLQAVWNFERLQNLGFLFSIVPAIRRLYPAGKEKEEAIKRHLEFFNTHPFMANIVFGVVASLEERMAGDPGAVKADDIRALKAIMSGPLAALGDAFFWATLRPFSAVIAIALVLNMPDQWKIAGPLFFLLFFNVFALHIRLTGLLRGYRLGTGVVDILKRFDLQDLINVVSVLGILVLGVLMLVFMSDFGFWRNIVFAGTFLISFFLVRRKVNMFLLIYAVLLGGIILGLVGIHS